MEVGVWTAAESTLRFYCKRRNTSCFCPCCTLPEVMDLCSPELAGCRRRCPLLPHGAVAPLSAVQRRGTCSVSSGVEAVAALHPSRGCIWRGYTLFANNKFASNS